MNEAESNSYFQKSLHNFTVKAAYRDAIRHLFDLGYSAEKIRDSLDYPVSAEVVEEEIRLYLKEKEETEKSGGKKEYVREYDAFGHPSFRLKK